MDNDKYNLVKEFVEALVYGNVTFDFVNNDIKGGYVRPVNKQKEITRFWELRFKRDNGTDEEKKELDKLVEELFTQIIYWRLAGLFTIKKI
jgi:hypothetical protein